MITILILAATLLTLLAWILAQGGCKHENLRGVANYYDKEHHCFVHLKVCEDCGDAIITAER